MGRHGGDQMLMSGARRWRITALLGVGVAALALVLSMCSTFGATGSGNSGGGNSKDGERVHGTPATPPPHPDSGLGWGFTHTEFSADEGGSAAMADAGELLKSQPMPQNQHIMGWGANNPEPSPGTYDFKELDSRIDLIRQTKGTPVITLCCAPDWMKGGKSGKDNVDWSQKSLEKAPDPKNYRDFAKLAGTIARRYPDVRHFIVWNEMKGFFDDSKRRWNYEGYTQLYNLVYKELKKVNKKNLVGGPYVVMDSYAPDIDTYASAVKGPWGSVDQRTLDAVDYWNRNKAGADFVVVDGSSYVRDDRLIPDEFTATDKFAAVSRWLRKETGLPVWWAEWYVELADENDDRKGWSESHRVAVQASGLMEMARGGTSTGFYWNPENRGASCPGCLWSSTELSNGGRELPMMKLLGRFDEKFPPGTRFEAVDIAADDKANVRVLADKKTVLVVNTLNRAISAKVDGQRFSMDAYEVRWLNR